MKRVVLERFFRLALPVWLVTALVVSACSSGGGGGNPDEKPNSSSSSSSTSSSSSSSSNVGLSIAETEYCGDITLSYEGVQGNAYEYRAGPGDCIGIIEDGSQKKIVDLTTSSVDEDLNGEVSISTKIKLYNSRILYSGLNIGQFNLSVEITNNSTEMVYCSVALDDVYYYNAAGEQITSSNTGSIDGDLYATNSSMLAYRDNCLSPGQTYAYTSSTTGIDPDLFDQIASASTPELTGRDQPRFVALPNIGPGSLTVTDSGRYPDLKFEFINTLDETLELQDDAHPVSFFDDEGYFVGWSYLYLYEALGKDELDLTPEDYLVDPNGGISVLRDEISDITAVRPATATRAVIRLRWLPLQ